MCFHFFILDLSFNIFVLLFPASPVKCLCWRLYFILLILLHDNYVVRIHRIFSCTIDTKRLPIRFYVTKSHNHAFLFFAFIAEILTTARRNGNVLIVVDTAGRVLELSQLLVILLEFLFCFVLFCFFMTLKKGTLTPMLIKCFLLGIT